MRSETLNQCFLKQFIFLFMILQVSLTSHPVFCEETQAMKGMTEAHNIIRRELGLPGLTWSDSLALYAQEWADYLASKNGCTMEHRPGTGNNGNKYGENLYWASAIRWSNGNIEAQEINPAKVVQNWSGEAEDYSYETNSCKRGKMCGHYTQVVWKKTVNVGCGRTLCTDMSQIWVCNYDPPGNFIDERPY